MVLGSFCSKEDHGRVMTVVVVGSREKMCVSESWSEKDHGPSYCGYYFEES